ncbi:MarR family winged helix-turn-helix transcriptional regulator [Capillimicrobium parvum]|nr:MarR family winged helix-turn-helix transcriptional regulator [Capillimicrobium parvum]
MPRPDGDHPAVGAVPPAAVDDAAYEHLASLRAGIRRYLAWAEQRAREQGMTPAQVQLALAIRAYADPAGPTLTELADTLLLRHHSVVGLVDRAEGAGLVRRERDAEYASRVHVVLTAVGERRLAALSGLHLEWLAEHGPQIGDVWRSFGPGMGV